MVLDPRKKHELVQVLLRAKNRTDGVNLLQNIAETGTASGDRGHREPVLSGMRYFSESQPAVTAKDEAARQWHKPMPIPRFHPSRNLAGFPHTGEIADMATARGAPLTTKPGFGVTDPYQGPAVPRHRAPLLRVADSEPDKDAPHQEKKMPEVHYKTSGEIWSDFLGGIGKGIAQGVVDVAFNSAKARRAMYTGVYTDTPTPVLFDPPTSSWDDTGRKIAPGITAVAGPAPLNWINRWRFKIGKVEPPKDLTPGTVLFGDAMHERIVEFLKAKYPRTIFRVTIKKGQRGVDMEHLDGPDPGFKYLDIKPNKPYNQRKLNSQIENWGYDEKTVKAISYDEQGNIYDGFSE